MLIAAYNPRFPRPERATPLMNPKVRIDVIRTVRRNAAQGIKFRQGRQALRGRKTYVFTTLACVSPRCTEGAPRMCYATREIQPFRPNCPECRNEPQHRLFRLPVLARAVCARKTPDDEPLIETPSAAYPKGGKRRCGAIRPHQFD